MVESTDASKRGSAMTLRHASRRPAGERRLARDGLAPTMSGVFTMRIALVHAPLQSTISDAALGHQAPLGLLMVAGPLLDCRHEVRLLDAGRERWTDEQVMRRLADFAPEIVLVGHSASTKSHPACLRLLRAVKAAMPAAITVYGGVHPTFHCEEILAQHPQVDVVVRGEGEATALDLVAALSQESSACQNGSGSGSVYANLSHVSGIAWRSEGRVVVSPPRPVIEDLESHRIAWELIDDWDKYQAFGLGRTAVVQFSRGCPHRCTYCGQSPFWQRWRHRDVARFVEELEMLHREHGIQFFWFADENPTTEKETWKALLEEIVRRDMGTRMTASVRAQDIVRDADLLELYRRAGFLYVLMGVETVTDETLRKVGKGSTVADGLEAVRLLRRHGILSIIDYIFGLEDETPATVWQALRGLHRYDSDFINALYLTPYSWTPSGREAQRAGMIEEDLSKWDCRHQVVAVRGLSRRGLFLRAKLVEALYHLHPRRLWRALTTPDRVLRQHFRFAYSHIVGVFWHEMLEYFRR